MELCIECRQCKASKPTLSGAENQRSEGRKSHSGGQNQPPGGQFPGLMIPHHQIGRLIGPGGKNIKRIENLAHVKISINKNAQGSDKPISIIGESKAFCFLVKENLSKV